MSKCFQHYVNKPFDFLITPYFIANTSSVINDLLNDNRFQSIQKENKNIIKDEARKEGAKKDKEYEIGMMLHHPNIRRTLDIDVNFETIILEHCDGIDLLDYLNDYDHSGHCGTVKLFSQLIDAVDYLHTNNIVHLDIKLENIIINPKNNIIKLIDLG